MPPIALQQIKEVALMSEDVPLNAGLTLERKAFQLLFSTEDKNEGVQALSKSVSRRIKVNNLKL